MLTISKLKRWSISYYIDTADTAARAGRDARADGGGLGEYYSEHDTRTPVWICAGDARTAAKLLGLSDLQRAGGEAEPALVAHWLDDGIAPNGAMGRTFGTRGVHGFDLTFSAPKSVSLLRVLRGDDVVQKGIADAHTTAISEAMEYLAQHAGYSRVHNPVTGEKDLVRLPGVVGIAYQHETSRCGDPHLHTHVVVPNRQARADGRLVSLDGTSLFHEAKAAGVIYQATLRRELQRSLGFEWEQVDPGTGMAELAGMSRETITAWSRRSSQLREWAAGHLEQGEDGTWSAAQLGTAQKATRPSKPEELAWSTLVAQWRADPRGMDIDRAQFLAARAARRAHARSAFDRARVLAAAETIDKAVFTRADLIEVLGAQVPVDSELSPREMLERAVDAVSVRLTAPRAAHQREGHERFTLDAILAEEAAVMDLVDARNERAQLWLPARDTAGLSADQRAAVTAIARSPWLVQPLTAPAGAGKTTCLRTLAAAAHGVARGTAIVLAPTGKAVDVALREGAGDQGYTVAKALQMLDKNELELDRFSLVIVDEAAMVGTSDLRRLLTVTTQAGAKTILVGDPHQLAPVKARGGMFAQLCEDLPWTQTLSEVWRMHDADEREASLALRDGDQKSVSRAVEWYRRHDRLCCGDEVTMAADAVTAYKKDIAAGKDALLLCDTKEMADALNRRLHHESVAAGAATVAGARGHQLAVGDLILTRQNDASIPLRYRDNQSVEPGPVRNGQRWQVEKVHTGHQQVLARRLDDNAYTIFPTDYTRTHITYGYALTVHSAQGVTADTTHAVLGETSSRALLYVAMTRGRQANSAHIFRHMPEGQEHGRHEPEVTQVSECGTALQAADLLRAILANDQPNVTAHTYTAQASQAAVPAGLRSIRAQHAEAVGRRVAGYRAWLTDQAARSIDADRVRERSASRSRELSSDYGIERV
ncbi:MobF family relaxase [Mycolicibacterium komossense]|uniref:Relaxase domain-containing protein n=1 Tax=Mycolicibacterium komossense TaxID=1779 RepID=A0ABT3CJ10_9MYCO|nr:MobF family relaxase [Mycolicibacterium komossense]MCV7229442.1 relaxase domain-containing protein [Mycolicibacterium komossense]